jgi:tetratricopeptide (TPR) repeat protein
MLPYHLFAEDPNSEEVTHDNEPFVEVHLDEIFSIVQDSNVIFGAEFANGIRKYFTKMRIFYDPDVCIDFISSYAWRKIFLTLTDKFVHIIPLIHDLPQIVHIYIYSRSRCEIKIDMRRYPKLRPVVNATSRDADKQLLQDIEKFRQDLLAINVANPINQKTKLLTDDTVKDQTPSTSQTSVDNLPIIWFQDDENGNPTVTSTAEKILNSAKKFMNIDECRDYIHSLPDDIRIFFISSKLDDESISSLLFSLTKIRFIYIFRNEEKNESISSQSSKKIRGIYSNIDSLCDQLLKDYKESSDAAEISISIFNKDKNQKTLRNLQEDNARFIWFQLLVDILIKIPYNYQTIDEMLAECEKYQTTTNFLEKKNIEDLRQNYQPSKALEYYTGATFLFRLLNQALRTENIDIIFVFRFFLSDMHNQLQQLYIKQFVNNTTSSSLDLFRGQFMNAKEFNIIKDNVDRLISINQFFSTTKAYDLAYLFAGCGDNNKPPDIVSVIFQIEIDDTGHSLKRPFACLQELSKVEDEQEVLFSPGTVFRIENVEAIPGNAENWYVQLKLIDDDAENEASNLRNQLEKKFCVNPKLTSLGEVLIKMGEYNKAERYFNIIMEHTTRNPEILGTVHISLGVIHHNRGKYHKALKYYQQALEIYLKNYLTFDPSDNIGVTYTHIGSVYRHLEKNQLALEYFNKALDIQKLPSRNGFTLNQIAMIHQRNGDYHQALEYFQRVLKIDEEVLNLDKYDPVLAVAYNNIGDTYIRLGDYDNALKYLQHALDKRLKGTVSTHEDLAAVYSNLSCVYLNKNCLNQALEMAEKALKIDTEALPEDHISISISRNAVANVYAALGDLNKSLYHMEKAVDIISKSDAKNISLSHIAIQVNYSGMQILQGNFSKGLNILENALKTQLEVFPNNSPYICETYLTLSLAYEMQNNVPKALLYLEECLEHARSSSLSINRDHLPLIQQKYNNLKTKNIKSDEKVTKLSFERADRYDGINEPNQMSARANEKLELLSLTDMCNRISGLNTMGTLNYEESNFELATKAFEDAILIYKRRTALTMADEQTLNKLMIVVYYNFAGMYNSLQDWLTAMKNSEESLRLALDQDEQHPLLAKIYNLLGNTSAELQFYSKAEYCLKLSIKTAEQILPYDHPDIKRYYIELKQLQFLMQAYPSRVLD